MRGILHADKGHPVADPGRPIERIKMQPKKILDELKSKGFGPFVEVPCSSLAGLIDAVQKDPSLDLINPANEGIAIGIASGAYLAGKKPVLMIQNSGLLNTLNAMTSLNQIYEIPVLIFVSWRGYAKDAPEHEIVGRDMEKYLRTFGIEYSILDDNFMPAIEKADKYFQANKKPYVLLVKPDYFDKSEHRTEESPFELSREESICAVKLALKELGYVFISTNGFISRESFSCVGTKDLYMMGSMGHALPLGIGVAKYSDKKVCVLDGDGAVLMHLGAMPGVRSQNLKNLLHVVFDNEVYASTDNQPTISGDIDLAKLAELSGYRHVIKVTEINELDAAIKDLTAHEGPNFLLIKVNPGNSKGCKRVSDEMTCPEIKNKFMERLNEK